MQYIQQWCQFHFDSNQNETDIFAESPPEVNSWSREVDVLLYKRREEIWATPGSRSEFIKPKYVETQ